MYTPSAEGEAIRARLALYSDLHPAILPDVSRLYLQIGEHTVSLQISNPVLRHDLAQRFICGPKIASPSLELVIADYLTEDTDLCILSPFRRVIAKRRGKLYFGAQDREALRVLAGSLGATNSSGAHNAALTETDFIQCLVEAEIMVALGRVAPHIDFLHAATIAYNGHAILLVGPSGAGKSTLASAATISGFSLLGDDVACVDLAQRLAYSYPRHPRLRPEAQDLLQSSDAPPAKVSTGCVYPIAAVCMLAGFASSSRLRPLAATSALWSFSGHLFHSERPAAAVLSRVAEHLTPLPCYELISGSPEETVALLKTLTENASSEDRRA